MSPIDEDPERFGAVARLLVDWPAVVRRGLMAGGPVPGPRVWVRVGWGLVLLGAGLGLVGHPTEWAGLLGYVLGAWTFGGILEIVDAWIPGRRGRGWQVLGGMVGLVPISLQLWEGFILRYPAFNDIQVIGATGFALATLNLVRAVWAWLNTSTSLPTLVLAAAQALTAVVFAHTAGVMSCDHGDHGQIDCTDPAVATAGWLIAVGGATLLLFLVVRSRWMSNAP